jgi:hypothetical protein
MAVVRVVRSSSLPPDRVLAAARDFTARRSEVFPAVQTERLVVHSQGETTADATEGTRFGPFVNWERCDYDWSRPDVVVADVTDSNIYEPANSRWEITAEPAEGGSTVTMTWTREFRRTPKGFLFGFAFRRFGQRLFDKYGGEVIENLERVES